MSIILKPRTTRQMLQAENARSRSPRSFATLVTAGAALLALLLATAIPAKADKKDDLAKALIAALVVGAIVSEIDDNHKPKPVKHPKVPAVCAISIEGAERSVTLYPESCLKDHGLSRLPRDCAARATIFGQRDRVYSTRCLRDAGFKVSGY